MMKKHFKNNFSITLSVFIAAFIISILSYIIFNQNIEAYTSLRVTMPEDIAITDPITPEIIEKMRNMDNIDKIGIRDDYISIKIDDMVLNYVNYNQDFFDMQHHFIKNGHLPQKENEVVISEKISKELKLDIGDTITITYGDRLLNNVIVDARKNHNPQEQFVDKTKKSCSITGIYHTINPYNIQSVIGLSNNPSGACYPCIRVHHLADIYQTKQELASSIQKSLKKSVSITINEGILHFFKISPNGMNIVGFLLSKLTIPFIILSIFVLMIKNIFKVWAIYKIKEFAMYQSIGATKLQLYNILLKDSLTISFLPLMLGEISGLAVVGLIFKKLFSLQSQQLTDVNIDQFSFQVPLIAMITILLLLVIAISIIFPTVTISKIDIVDGLKGNIHLNHFRKVRKKSLFNELNANNRKLLRPQLFVMIAGIMMIECIVAVSVFNEYNTLRANNLEGKYTINISYDTSLSHYKSVFSNIVDKTNSNDYIISRSQFLYVDTSDLSYSNEFKKIGFDPNFDNKIYYSDTHLVPGLLIGVEDDVFKSLGGKENGVILVNLVQENPKDFYKKASFIPYLNPETKSITVKFEDGFKPHKLNIVKHIKKPLGNEILDLYNIQLITTLDNFENLLYLGKTDFKSNNMSMESPYYHLKMAVQENDIPLIKIQIDDIMSKSLQANEKYKIRDTLSEKKLRTINNQSLLFLMAIIFISAFMLNIANSFSVTNLYFFNRQKEIGTLLSCGMVIEDMEKLLKKDISKRIVLALSIATCLSIGIIGYFIHTVPYISAMIYLKMIPFHFLIPLLFAVCISSYIIYVSSMKKILKNDSIIALLRQGV